MRIVRILPAISILATLLFATPVNAASSQVSISIIDLAHFNPTTFSFPGAGAFDFHPGVVTVSQGGTVTWTDNGYDQHTVTSYTTKMTVNFEGVNVQLPIPDGHFDSGIQAPIQSGQSWSLNTAELSPGDYHYFCQIHPWMSSFVWVLDHPFAAVTDKEGNYEIKGVPAAELSVKYWHESFDKTPKTEKITIKGDTTKDFTVSAK